jgi:hypothetical protein
MEIGRGLFLKVVSEKTDGMGLFGKNKQVEKMARKFLYKHRANLNTTI